MHGDYHTNNIMVQNGQPLLIDMDTLCMGHPVFEFGGMFNAFIGYAEHDHSNIMEFFGYSFETAWKFWNLSLKMYLGTDDEARFKEVETKASVIGYTRLLRRTARRISEPGSHEKIEYYKKRLVETINKVDTLDF
jgi:aminoglycoside phosphotransferase (APT) family kinase protein